MCDNLFMGPPGACVNTVVDVQVRTLSLADVVPLRKVG